MAPLVLLDGEKLRKLAKIIRNQEIEAIKNLPFKSEEESAKYLRDVRDNYNFVIKLLDETDDVKQKYKDDETRSSIVHETYSYLQKAVNISLQAVRNYTLRTNFLTKIGAHSKDIFNALETLDPSNVTNAARLAKGAKQYNECMQQFMLKHQSQASRDFSKWLKDSNTKFEDLVTRYQKKRSFTGQFKNLGDEEKFVVYNDIIKASGRGGVITKALSMAEEKKGDIIDALADACGVTGLAVLILNAGIMVWDIFTSGHIIEQTTTEAITYVASAGGAIVGGLVIAAIPTLVGIEASALFVVATAVLCSIGEVFVIGAFVPWLVDFIFNSGGYYPLSTDGHHCYVAPLPDGEAMARQIAHSNH